MTRPVRILLLLPFLGACGGGGSDAPADAAVPVLDAATPPAADAGVRPQPFTYDGPCVPLGDDLCAVNPAPFPGHVAAIAASGPGDVWFAGAGGLLAHWDGAAFRVHPVEGLRAASFTAVAAPAPDCAWAAGYRQVARWDGAAWRRVADPPEIVWDLAAPTCEAPLVRGEAKVYGWNGTGWDVVADAAALQAPNARVAGLAGRDGAAWIMTAFDGTHVLERTPAGWEDRTPDDPEFTLPDRLALGPGGRVVVQDSRDGMTFVRADGTWSRLPNALPNAGTPWVEADGTIWSAIPGDPLGSSTVSRWNGAAWEESARLFRPQLGGSLEIAAIAGDGAGTVWAGGVNGGVARYDAAGWTTLAAGAPWPRFDAARVGDEIWTTGALGLVEVQRAGIALRDLDQPGSQVWYDHILVRAPGDVWLAGRDLIADKPIAHFDGQTFTYEALFGAIPQIRAFFEAEGGLWAVAFLPVLPSSSHVLRRGPAGGWTPDRSIAGATLSAGWSDGHTILVTGSQVANGALHGFTWERTGGAWGPDVESPELFALAGPDLAHLFAAGKDGVYRWADGAWTPAWTAPAGLQQLTAIAVDGDRVWAVGNRTDPADPDVFAQGTLVRFDGASWTETMLPGIDNALGVSVVDGVPWILGGGGAVLRGPAPR